jgi:hypothetical protein
MARRLPRPMVCASRSINTSNGQPPWIPGNFLSNTQPWIAGFWPGGELGGSLFSTNFAYSAVNPSCLRLWLRRAVACAVRLRANSLNSCLTPDL